MEKGDFKLKIGKFQTFDLSSLTTLIGCRPKALITCTLRVNQSDGTGATISLFSQEIWKKSFFPKKVTFFWRFFFQYSIRRKNFFDEDLNGKKKNFFWCFSKSGLCRMLRIQIRFIQEEILKKPADSDLWLQSFETISRLRRGLGLEISEIVKIFIGKFNGKRRF